MSEGNTPPRGTRVDDALRAWPDATRTAADWERLAKRIESRIASGEVPPSYEAVRGAAHAIDDDALFAAPLADEPGEERAARVFVRERERKSFQDLARFAALTPKAPNARRSEPEVRRPIAERKEDSGVVDLKTLEEDDRLARAPLAAPAHDAKPTPAQRPALKLAPTLVAAAPPARADAVPQIAPPQAMPPRRIGTWIATVVAAAAVAAAVSFALRPPPPPVASAPPASASPAAEVDHSAPRATAAQTEPREATQAPAVSPAPAPSAPEGADPHALPSVQLALAPTKTAPKPTAKEATPAMTVAAVSATAPLATTTTARAPDDKALMDAILSHEGMRQAAGTAPPSGTGAEPMMLPESSNLPLKPAQGAVSASLARVLGGARSCLGSEDGTSTATVMFRANGTVQSVSVTGDAQGKPAESCIRAALSRATVAPFTQPSFNGFVVVRPN